MKRILLCMLASVMLAIAPLTYSGCSTPPTERTAAVQTLKAVGHSAEAAVELSAKLYQDGRITAAQARQVLDLYNLKFQPAYRVAVTAAQADLSSAASPDLLRLANDLTQLVVQLTTKTL
jgi:hypothetical protein